MRNDAHTIGLIVWAIIVAGGYLVWDHTRSWRKPGPPKIKPRRREDDHD